MPAEPAIRVAPVDTSLRHGVLQLRTRPEQDAFVSPTELTLPDAERCPGSIPMAILHGDTVVGYYRIEQSARSITGRDIDTTSLGLRSFQIDAQWQGRGLGRRALILLLQDMAEQHPSARQVMLIVGDLNIAAMALYRRAGFTDGIELYHGCRSGAQYLLWRELP
jgi:ribosomal protein S18 acetylase RimI-like enzyme